MTLALYQVTSQTGRCDNGFVPIYDCGKFRVPFKENFSESDFSEDLFENQLAQIEKSNIKNFGVLVGTPKQVQRASRSAQFLYLPGEVCRQADVLDAASQTAKLVFLERGAFLSPRDLLLALPKLARNRVVLVDAGSAFGYGDRVLDARAFAVYGETQCEVGVHLSDLLRPEGAPYTFEPDWLHHEKFVAPLLKVCQAFQVQHIVVNSHSKVTAEKLLSSFTGAST